MKKCIEDFAQTSKIDLDQKIDQINSDHKQEIEKLKSEHLES